MNAPHQPASATVPCADIPAMGRASLAFTWRYDLCPDCDSATGSRGCETCEGSGEITCACFGCNRVVPLNDDGECRDCASLTETIVTVDRDGRAYLRDAA